LSGCDNNPVRGACIDNPNRFFVFAVDFSDLPGYDAQQLAKKSCR